MLIRDPAPDVEPSEGGDAAHRAGRGFVGRDAERAILDAAWLRARSGAATIVSVHGPAGFGKTTLVGDLLRRAKPPAVLHATGDPDEAMLPFGVLDQLFRPGSGSVSDTGAGTSAHIAAAALPAVLRAAVAGEPVNPLVVGTGVVEALAAMPAPSTDSDEDAAVERWGGIMLVVDDVQWADAASIRGLVFALRRLRSEPGLAVLACRDSLMDRLPAGLQHLLRDAATDLPLSGFGAAETAALAAARGVTGLSRRAIDRLVESSAGSPLHALALLDELARAQLEGDLDEPLPAPRTFAGLVTARLQSCDDHVQELMQAAAVAGDGQSLRLIADLAGVREALTAAERAGEAGLLQTPVVGGAIRLAHPLTRSAVYYATPVSTRRSGPVHLHLYVSAFLADAAYRMGEWDVTIAEAESGAASARDLDNAWTLPMLHALAAMPHAARGNVDAAAVHVDAAMAAAAAAGDIPSYLWAVIAQARLARARRDMPGVVAAFEPLTAIAHLDGMREPGVQAWQSLYADALVATGRWDEAEAVLDEAAEFATSRQHRVEQLAVARVRAQLAAARGDLVGALEAMALNEELRGSIEGRPFDTAQFDLVHGALLRRAAKRSAAAAVLRRALAEFERLGAEPWAGAARTELRRCGTSPHVSSGAELTPHEHLVAGLVAQGLSNKRVAAELGVTEKAVEYYLGNVFAKLGVHSRVQLATLHRPSDPDQPTS